MEMAEATEMMMPRDPVMIARDVPQVSTMLPITDTVEAYKTTLILGVDLGLLRILVAGDGTITIQIL
jgi:hypothetical protein